MPTTLKEAQAQSLRLATHVRACRLDDQVILLDLRAGRYLGIGGRASSALAACVDDWPVPTSLGIPSPLTRADDPACEHLARQLLLKGLLTDRDGASSDKRSASMTSVASLMLDEATASLDLGDIAARTRFRAQQLARFLSCAAKTAWWLRCRSLQSIAVTLTRRRERSIAEAGTVDLARMKQCAVTYERLRPLLLTARDKCLFDSLALTNFLAAEQLFPRWVIGVKTSPFGAHAWVQAGTTVLNDQHEYVRRFRPILVA